MNKAIVIRDMNKYFPVKFSRKSKKRGLEESHIDADRFDEKLGYAALRNIDLDIPAGTATAIIGRNGAGKSTLLQIMAGVMKPSSGQIQINGQVASLLSLATGFRKYSTGRENIYLYGALMGLNRRDVDDVIDEVIEFSELGRFIDLQLVTYSSGMRSRLGFACAMSLSSDILLLDEILSVGDAAFKAKATAKMHEQFDGIGTIVYVSHSMGAVRQLCTHAIWLDKGQVREFGPMDEVLDHYEGISSASGVAPNIYNISMFKSDGEKDDRFAIGEKIRVNFMYEGMLEDYEPVFRILVYDPIVQQVVSVVGSDATLGKALPVAGGFNIELETQHLKPRQYQLRINALDTSDDKPSRLVNKTRDIIIYDPDEDTSLRRNADEWGMELIT